MRVDEDKQRNNCSALHSALVLSDKSPLSLPPRVWAFGGVVCVNAISEPTGSDERHSLDGSVALYFFQIKCIVHAF